MEYKVINRETKLKCKKDGCDLYCELCGKWICRVYDINNRDHNYCPRCGQAIETDREVYMEPEDNHECCCEADCASCMCCSKADAYCDEEDDWEPPYPDMDPIDGDLEGL